MQDLGEQRQWSERRRGPDKWVKVVRILGYISWGVFIVTLFLLIYAKPQGVTFLDRILNVQVNSSWDLQLIQAAFLLIIALALVSVFGLAVNFSRSRRKSDKFSKSLIFSSLMSVVGIFLYIYNFIL